MSKLEIQKNQDDDPNPGGRVLLFALGDEYARNGKGFGGGLSATLKTARCVGEGWNISAHGATSWMFDTRTASKPPQSLMPMLSKTRRLHEQWIKKGAARYCNGQPIVRGGNFCPSGKSATDHVVEPMDVHCPHYRLIQFC